eukprot:scaffold278797_cov15-Tisochrysis_lutea.AAC.1
MKQQQIVEEVVMRGLRPRFPPGTPRGYAELAQACWSGAATSRPSFEEVGRSWPGSVIAGEECVTLRPLMFLIAERSHLSAQIQEA